MGSAPDAAIAPSSTALSGLRALRGERREVGEHMRRGKLARGVDDALDIEPAVAHGAFSSTVNTRCVEAIRNVRSGVT